jgi:hypothetical protein
MEQGGILDFRVRSIYMEKLRNHKSVTVMGQFWVARWLVAMTVVMTHYLNR